MDRHTAKIIEIYQDNFIVLAVVLVILLTMSCQNQVLVVENFIGGKFIKTDQYLDSFDPSCNNVWAKIPDSELDEVNNAVAAARNAFLS